MNVYRELMEMKQQLEAHKKQIEKQAFIKTVEFEALNLAAKGQKSFFGHQLDWANGIDWAQLTHAQQIATLENYITSLRDLRKELAANYPDLPGAMEKLKEFDERITAAGERIVSIHLEQLEESFDPKKADQYDRQHRG